MKNILILSAVLIVPFSLFAADKVDKAADSKAADIKARQGVWKPVKAVIGGMSLPSEALKAITLTITGDKYEVAVQGESRPDKGTSVLDTTTMPKRMSTTSTEGPNKGKTFLAIYEFQDADTLQVCYDLSGAKYPTEFKSEKGTQLYLVTYKREKK